MSISRQFSRIKKFFVSPEHRKAYLRSKFRENDVDLRRRRRWIYGLCPRIPAKDLFPGLKEITITLDRAFDRDPRTSIDLFELTVLCGLAQLLPARNILEIGTYDGNTSLNLARNSPDDARVVTVDLPPSFSGSLALRCEGMSNVSDRAVVGRQLASGHPKITQIYGDSATLDWGTFNGPFDMIFIDGCHSYNYVKSDTTHALSLLKPGGLLIWHDYGQYFDVSTAVDEYREQLNINAISGTRLAVGQHL